jgi:hypothetical protein
VTFESGSRLRKIESKAFAGGSHLTISIPANLERLLENYKAKEKSIEIKVQSGH